MEEQRREENIDQRERRHESRLQRLADLLLGGRKVERPKGEEELSLAEQAEILEEEVYGEPLQVKGEPSIGTEETPPPTDIKWDYDPGGWTKQGEEKPIGGTQGKDRS